MEPSAPLTSLSRSVPRDPSAPTSLIEGTCLLKLGPAEGVVFFIGKRIRSCSQLTRALGVSGGVGGGGPTRSLLDGSHQEQETKGQLKRTEPTAPRPSQKHIPGEEVLSRFQLTLLLKGPFFKKKSLRDDNDDSLAERFGGRR